MSLNIRRVVTGHDANGKAVVSDRRNLQERDLPAGEPRELRDLVDRRIPDRQ